MTTSPARTGADTGTPARSWRLERAVEGRVVGGVAAGLAAATGLPVAAVRVAFVVLGFAGGAGPAAYAVFWVFLPQHPGPVPPRRGHLVGTAALLLGLGVLAVTVPSATSLPLGTTLPLAVAVAGIVLVWQQSDADQRARWRAGTGSVAGAWGGAAVLRLAAGIVLLSAGLVGFLASRGQLAVARAGLLSTVVVVLGLALVSSPWWVAMGTELRAERRERIRSQERAEVAAHLHDSVLQTLTLIQKAAGSPSEVQRLARGQERALRAWLYTERTPQGSLRAALEDVAVEVEQVHGVPVEVVVVGEVTLQARGQALVAATREAVINAAVHSGTVVVDVYAEAEDGTVEVFVRDRGRGFDPEAVPADRHGLWGSVVGRMERHGGTATIRSAPGAGTEVRLVLPRE